MGTFNKIFRISSVLVFAVVCMFFGSMVGQYTYGSGFSKADGARVKQATVICSLEAVADEDSLGDWQHVEVDISLLGNGTLIVDSIRWSADMDEHVNNVLNGGDGTFHSLKILDFHYGSKLVSDEDQPVYNSVAYSVISRYLKW